MTRSSVAVGLVAVVLTVLLAAQRATPVPERAYRASNVGVAHLEQYDFPGAVERFREALEVAPHYAPARLNLALALFYAGELEGARREAEAVRERLPDRPHPDYLLGLIARETGRPADALTHFQRVRALAPDDVGTAINIGQVHLQEGRYREAGEAFRIATELEPYNATAAYGLAMALIRGASDEGPAAMRRFEQLRDSEYATTYSRTYLEQGRYAEAIGSTGAEPELVDERTPDVTFRPSDEAVPLQRIGGVTLHDYDRDGDLDLLVGHVEGVRLLRNDSGRFLDVTADAGLEKVPARAGLAGDVDNDGAADLLLLLADRGIAVYRQSAAGRFSRLPAEGLEYPHAASTAAWLDADHDGDLDLFVGGATRASTGRLFRNNGNLTFTDITSEARIAAPGPIGAAVATDFDNRRDVDLLVGTADRGTILLRNLRDGTFENAAGSVGLATIGGAASIAAGDVNKDGFTDFFIGSTGGGSLVLSDGRGAFRPSSDLDERGGARAALFIDYDNDGLLDLVTLRDDGLRVLRNLGSEWVNTTTRAVDPGKSRGAFSTAAAGDIDGDGDVDLVTGGDRLTVWRNDGGNRRHSLRTQLTARVSNRDAIGAKVEMRAGSLAQKLEVYSSSPAAAPADLVFGLGARSSVDVVRVLWPAGILQAELGAASGGPPEGTRTATTMRIEELDRKPSSCPYLYTWNGERFEFVTDFLGGGEMGYWLAPGMRNTPDPDEYVRIDGTKLAARDGRFELRITNELEEALFLDRTQLVIIDHPSDREVHPAEGLTAVPRPFELFHAASATDPLAAADDHGHDVLDRVTAMDRRYPDDFALHRIRGYAAPHALTLTLPAGERRLLLLTGWTDYAFSGDNVAAHQAGLALTPPSLEVLGPDGQWRRMIDNIGFPVGRPQTVVVDLAALDPNVRQVRIATSMRVYWDRIRVAQAAPPGGAAVTRTDPLMATLGWRGFSAEVTPDGREPYAYDYDRVSPTSPWKQLPGRYTREGDVRDLLVRTDDMFVIARPGDEISLAFDATTLQSLPQGWSRTFLLYADGFSKEMDLNSSSPDQLAPLPFHGMTGYPYSDDEAYPSTEAHRRYRDRYNTRVVPRAVPPLELSGKRR